MVYPIWSNGHVDANVVGYKPIPLNMARNNLKYGSLHLYDASNSIPTW